MKITSNGVSIVHILSSCYNTLCIYYLSVVIILNNFHTFLSTYPYVYIYNYYFEYHTQSCLGNSVNTINDAILARP